MRVRVKVERPNGARVSYPLQLTLVLEGLLFPALAKISVCPFVSMS